MHTLTFTLKQHTPIIHFQHNQDGATLRATELKPKLDRFIISKVGGITLARQLFGAAFTSVNNDALDYNVKLIIDNGHKVSPINYDPTNEGKFKPNFPNIFGNVETEADKKSFVACETISVNIRCFHSILRSFIEKNFNEFISRTNFGYRQSKGFGSFSDSSGKIVDANASFKVKRDNSRNCYDLFEAIDLFYKSLRGGIRVYGRGGICLFYFKSLLVSYYHKKGGGTKWDKAAIKEVLENGKINVIGSDIKDLLGLSTNEIWHAKYNGVEIVKADKRAYEIKAIEKLVKETNDSKRKQQLADERNELKKMLVERFQSPITFKPVYDSSKQEWTVYLFFQSIPTHYLGTTIVAEVSNEKVNLDMWRSFTLADFMKYVSGFNSADKIEEHIETYLSDENAHELDAYLSHKSCKTLSAIYSSFKLINV